MGRHLRILKSSIVSIIALIALILLLFQPPTASAQTSIYEFDAVVVVEGWSPPFNGSNSNFGLAYLWVESNDQWFGPSRLLNDGSISQNIQIDEEKLAEAGVEYKFYLSASDAIPTGQPLLFKEDSQRLIQERAGKPGVSYVIEWEVSFRNPDDDSDGIPSLDESFMLWHTEINGEFALVSSDPFNQDTDRDGIMDGSEIRGVNEWACRTSPRLEDSDADGLTDIQEIRSNPCQGDTDEDGLSDGDELNHGTDPLDPDTDQDGLMDGPEVHRYNTNPLITDSDGDGLKDGEEALRYFTQPLNPDSDEDGLGDAEEKNRYDTNPLAPDTDGDGLTDKGEVQSYNTDPLVPDTDGDELRDGDEVQSYNTDPLNPDTDGDGITDGDEVLQRDSDPLVANFGATGSVRDCDPNCSPSEPFLSTSEWVFIAVGIFSALVIGYIFWSFWIITSTAIKIENIYGFSHGDSLGESTEEFSRLRKWPFAQRLYRLRWKNG